MVPSGLLLGLLLGVLPAPHAVDLQSTATAAALAPSGTVPSPLPLPKPMSAAATIEAGAALLRRVILKTEAAVFGSRSWSALPPFEFDSLPSPLPKPAAKQRLARPVRFSWYTNVWCAAAFLRLP